MTVEERLGATMRAHAAEAPTHVPWPAAAGFVRRPRRRPTGRFVLAVALVAALVAGGTWLAVAWPRTAPRTTPAAPITPADCPSTWAGVPSGSDYEVPAAATVPDASARLVPDATPVAVAVCGYVGGRHALTGSESLSGDLAEVAAALTDLPRGTGASACPTYAAATDGDDYLLGLTYDDGTVWVTAPGNHCSGAGNGAFNTSANLRVASAASLAAGHWVGTAGGSGGVWSGTPCADPPGRLGQDSEMVPDAPTSLTICRFPVSAASEGTVVPADRIGAVVSALNALAAEPNAAPHACESTGAAEGESSALFFGYGSGAGMRVYVTVGCRSGTYVDNGSLRADASPELVSLLADLTR